MQILFQKTNPLSSRQKTAMLLPVLLVVFTVFFAYDTIQYFAAAAAILAITMTLLNLATVRSAIPIAKKMGQLFPFFLLFVGAVGLGASYSLAQEQQALERDPNHVSSCSINPIIACGSVITSDQGHALGVSNPKLGLVAYGGLMLLGYELLLGLVLSKNMWRAVWFGSLFAIVYSLWLVTQSLYTIGSLCLYCATIWAVTLPFFFYTTNYLIFNKIFSVPKNIRLWFEKNHMVPLLVVYSVLFLLIYFRWSDYWNSLL